MRRVLVVAILALMVVPAVAWADIDLGNAGGLISISNAGIISKGSQLKSYNNIVAAPGHALGSVTFSTGALVSGSLQAGGVFSSKGSSFVVVGKNKAVPKGVIFNGHFVGNITWTLVSQKGQQSTYTLSGNLTGTLYDGRTVSGTTTQTIITYKGQFVKGIGHIKIGNTQLNVPEPGTLGLLGTGLIGIAGMVRRKLVS